METGGAGSGAGAGDRLPIHVCHVSTKESVDLIRKAKAEGKQYDHCICIGPLPMMKFVCQITKEYGVATMVDMNCI